MTGKGKNLKRFHPHKMATRKPGGHSPVSRFGGRMKGKRGNRK